MSEPTGSGPDPWVTSLRATHADIARRLDGATTAIDRDILKREIISFFKRVDGALTDLAKLKEEIRVLVNQYKQVASTADSAQAPQFTGAFPVVQADHLGASTFIEKGWSRISLGDHAGAKQALQRALQLAPGDPQAESLLGWAQMLQEKYDDALCNFSKVLMQRAGQLAGADQRGLHLPQEGHLRRGDRAPVARPSGWTTTARRRCTRTSTWDSCISSGKCSRTPRRSSGRRSRSGPT